MMNLELLMWVAQHGGDQRLRDIAITMPTAHWKDISDPMEVLTMFGIMILLQINLYANLHGRALPMNQHGAVVNHGALWFTMMYRFTKDKRYLDQAKKIAGFYSITQICRKTWYHIGILMRQIFPMLIAMLLLLPSMHQPC
jgi:hypothetical protein